MSIVLGILSERGHLVSRAKPGDLLRLTIPLDGPDAPTVRWRQRLASGWVDIPGSAAAVAPFEVPTTLLGYDVMAQGTTPGGVDFTTQVLRIEPAGPVLKAPYYAAAPTPGTRLDASFVAGVYTHASGVAEQYPSFLVDGEAADRADLIEEGTTIDAEEVVAFGDGTTYRFPLLGLSLPVPDDVFLSEEGDVFIAESGEFLVQEAA